MSTESPRAAAHHFTPELTELIEDPLYSERVWGDARLSLRDRSLVTLGAVVALDKPAELRAQLGRAVQNGVTVQEISLLITHVAFYAGYPAAIAASMIAHEVLGPVSGSD
jgi:4-carboxymuconolactone decarboxylase